MPKRAREPELSGTGPDGLPYQVKQDGKASKQGCKYKIYFGKGLRENIRFPPGQELTHENTITALRGRASNSGQRPNLSTPGAGTAAAAADTAAAAAPATLDAAVVAEGQTFAGPAALPAHRPTSVPDRLDPEGQPPRDYAHERRRRTTNAAAAEKKRAAELELANDNKRLHAENESLQRQLDEVNADVLVRYAKAASEALMENLEDSGHSDEVHYLILDYLETALDEGLCTIVEGDEDGGHEEEKEDQQPSQSFSAKLRGMKMTKQEYARFHTDEVMQRSKLRRAEAALAAERSMMEAMVHQRDLTINKLQKTVRGLKSKVYAHAVPKHAPPAPTPNPYPHPPTPTPNPQPSRCLAVLRHGACQPPCQLRRTTHERLAATTSIN